MRFLLKISLALKLTTFQVHGQLPNEPITEVRCNNVDYWCHLHLCKQRGYKKNVLMTSTLKANIIVSDGSMNTTNTQLKKIDDRQMMLTFSPKLAIGWEDSRVISIDPIIDQGGLVILHPFQLDEIWRPTITIDRLRGAEAGHGKVYAYKTGRLSNETNCYKMTFFNTKKVTWTLPCKMDFSSYPFDRQVQTKIFILYNQR